MTDDDICDYCTSEEASKSEDEEDTEESCIPWLLTFDQCLTWLEKQPEADYHDVAVLKELRSLAARKKVSSMRQ